MAWHGIDVTHATRLSFAVCLSNRAEFCSLSTKFEEVQYNIVMIGSKEEDIFFLFLPSLRKLHTRTLLGHGFVSFVAKKKDMFNKTTIGSV